MTDTPSAPGPISRLVPVVEMPPSGIDLTLEPGEAERAALARHVGALALPAFRAVLHLAPEKASGVHVTGRVEASVTQACGVTLEPFDAPLAEEVDVHFVPAGTPVPEPEEGEEFDPPDEIVGGAIDVGALAAEFLALGMDPYPRKPGVVFEPPAEPAGAASPFSALARLKDRS
ncbi:YceD family protein [Xanthobacter tagetidis]|uniref:DUF177 domain-containing protein n=1 Tax=Xanthobacter tagetidis TaxID=60216 RepID=A0A3L7AE57_9HYPH|nr:DUF177 domain-containing protein [Xanthobacter tagetidis]MBB6309682.1 uncharacterized metal-binding protein YceD (DUF177 family) [Xanthobacter tagetidis]RLP78275.1 DUF177 domain-containing protein [Xanthobacter tagetidis]